MMDFAQNDIARSVSYEGGCVAPDHCYEWECRSSDAPPLVVNTPLFLCLLGFSTFFSSPCTFHLSLILDSNRSCTHPFCFLMLIVVKYFQQKCRRRKEKLPNALFAVKK